MPPTSASTHTLSHCLSVSLSICLSVCRHVFLFLFSPLSNLFIYTYLTPSLSHLFTIDTTTSIHPNT